ncbi:hypothetical protein AGR3A_Cc380002 [Agrobacterium tomkonis CFBP 6623]|uniref:Uncharacterized protein n=1 Tax=Agrobacterium tomkonis CFBP 6623 TaxID=1183432 RepID=A0A1S7Q191_9HYPH|nr:hypothetical protein AGR3A_Cc380002 [Agrobacterium tomkonis CFBP 6623]
MTLSECSPFITDFKWTATCPEIQPGQHWIMSGITEERSWEVVSTLYRQIGRLLCFPRRKSGL